MKYFVSAEKSPYFFWQLELLIESFRLNKIENELVIALADVSENTGLPKLLSKSNCFLHENFGRNCGYLPANKPLSILAAIQNKLISQPFILLDPDYVIRRPISKVPKEVGCPKQSYMELSHIRNIPWDIDKFLKNEKLWHPCGASYYFNNIPENVFFEVPKLIQKFGGGWWCIEMVAWMIAFINNNVKVEEIQYEELLTDSFDCDLIHYHHGVPEHFWKHNFKNIPFNCFSFEPYKAILSLNPEISSSVRYLQKVVRSYLDLAE